MFLALVVICGNGKAFADHDLGEIAPRHTVANALAAAALVRAYGVEPRAVRDGLRNFDPGAHRIQVGH